MTRITMVALPALLAFAGLAQAQSDDNGGLSANTPRLINSRYQPEPSSGSLPIRTLYGTPSNPRFAPLAFIDNVYRDVLGRAPSPQESSFWLKRMSYQSRADIALELQQRRPRSWLGNYDPRYGGAYDPGYGSRYYPDPASLNFRDPSGPYFKSPYFPNYEYRRNIRAFPTRARG